MRSVRINTEQSLRRHRETERTRATATVPDDVSENETRRFRSASRKIVVLNLIIHEDLAYLEKYVDALRCNREQGDVVAVGSS